ncbi:MAG: sugar nucleotide-binding protein [Planctomycetes bacterium]|nr:sugar nucleotide-binding protein [Planctomycetota bacterium]
MTIYPQTEIPRNWRILLTGASSIHGWPVFKALTDLMEPERLFAIRPPKMRVPEGPNVRSLHISDRRALMQIRETFKPTHVIHAAGVCDLDVCEERSQWAENLNTDGCRAVVQVFGESCPIIYLSTDLVFSGNQPPPGGYAEHHPTDPISVVGKTFQAAEQEITSCPGYCIIRLGLPLGDSVTGTKGAIDWIEHRFRRGLPVTLFHDEWRSCIPCEEIGRIVPRMLVLEATGLFHLGGGKPMSLHEVGCLVLARGDYPPHLLTALSRHEETNGPPRIGDVSFDSRKIRGLLDQKQSA